MIKINGDTIKFYSLKIDFKEIMLKNKKNDAILINVVEDFDS
jgi:hypothetical protein